MSDYQQIPQHTQQTQSEQYYPPPQQPPPQQYPPSQQCPPQQYPPQQYPPQQYPPQQYPPQQYTPQQQPNYNQVMPIPQQPQQQQMVTVQRWVRQIIGSSWFVKQKFELLEAITGCETENKYVVFAADKDGEKKKKLVLFKCKEKSGFLERYCLCGDCRPFKAKVEHESKIPGAKDGEKCFEYQRDFKCTFLCLQIPEMKVYLTENSEHKKYLGKIMKPWTFCDYQLDVYDAKDELAYKIIGNCCQIGLHFKECPFEPCQTVQFYVHDPVTGEKLSELIKVVIIQKIFVPKQKTAGCMKAAISDADNFSLVFPTKASPEMRAVLMAAVIMLDFMFFEESPADRNRQNNNNFF